MNQEKPKVVLVHDYLVQHGGAEKTLEAISELYPDADIYTGLYDKEKFISKLNSKNIYSNTSKILKIFPKYLSFLMPLVFENFDLSKYDIVISDSSCWAKGVLTKPNQLHISYIHTPPRFLYKYSVESQKRDKWYFKPFISVIDSFLRVWDFNAAQRPDYLVANSVNVQKRIGKFYRRESVVIYPPVDTTYAIKEKFDIGKKYYVALGRLVAYKNFDTLIEVFNRMPDKTLVIIGSGQEETKLKQLAKTNIIFLGRASEEKKQAVLENCLGLINPVTDEDFGIVPIEAMSHGKPVLCHKSGGATEMIDDKVGLFFGDVNVGDITKALIQFENNINNGRYNSEVIKGHARKFSKERFQKEFLNFVESKFNPSKM